MTENLIDKKINEYKLLSAQLAILVANLTTIKNRLVNGIDPSDKIAEFEGKEARTFDYMRRLINIYSDKPVELVYSNGGYNE